MKLFIKPRLSARMATGIILILTSVGLLIYRLATLTGGLNWKEYYVLDIKTLVHQVWVDPTGLPLILSRIVVAAVAPTNNAFWSRLPSVLLGLILAWLLYWLTKRWYGYRLALFGTIMFISAPWFLHSARLATGDILFPLAMATLLVLGALWHQKERPQWLIYVSVVAVGLTIYVPGMIWLVMCFALFERSNILATLRAKKGHTSGATLLGLLIITPLVHSLVVNWHLYRQLLGLPATVPNVLDFGQHALQTWQYIFIGGWHIPIANLGGLPIVDILTSIAFVVGLYLYSKHPRAVRTRELVAAWLIGTILIALRGNVSIYLLLPIVVILSVGGIGYLLHLWLKVFPKNPVARSFGIVLISIVIFFAIGYNLTNYFVAWPSSPVTKAAFHVLP